MSGSPEFPMEEWRPIVSARPVWETASHRTNIAKAIKVAERARKAWRIRQGIKSATVETIQAIDSQISILEISARLTVTDRRAIGSWMSQFGARKSCHFRLLPEKVKWWKEAELRATMTQFDWFRATDPRKAARLEILKPG